MLHKHKCACGKSFSSSRSDAMYCSEGCKKKAEWRRRKNDPAYQAKRAAYRAKRAADGNPIRPKHVVGAAEAGLIMDCAAAGWAAAETSSLILDIFGWTRTPKVVTGVIRRLRDVAKDRESISVGPADRIPDYRGANDAFIAAMRAAPECPPEGIYKDPRPLCAQRFYRPPVYGGSVAADVAELGFSKGNRW